MVCHIFFVVTVHLTKHSQGGVRIAYPIHVIATCVSIGHFTIALFSKLKTGRKTVASNEKDFGKRVKSAAYQLDFREDSGVVGSEVPGLTCPKHKPPTSIMCRIPDAIKNPSANHGSLLNSFHF